MQKIGGDKMEFDEWGETAELVGENRIGSRSASAGVWRCKLMRLSAAPLTSSSHQASLALVTSDIKGGAHARARLQTAAHVRRC